jgi:hypothetical protein
MFAAVPPARSPSSPGKARTEIRRREHRETGILPSSIANDKSSRSAPGQGLRSSLHRESRYASQPQSTKRVAKHQIGHHMTSDHMSRPVTRCEGRLHWTMNWWRKRRSTRAFGRRPLLFGRPCWCNAKRLAVSPPSDQRIPRQRHRPDEGKIPLDSQRTLTRALGGCGDRIGGGSVHRGTKVVGARHWRRRRSPSRFRVANARFRALDFRSKAAGRAALLDVPTVLLSRRGDH